MPNSLAVPYENFFRNRVREERNGLLVDHKFEETMDRIEEVGIDKSFASTFLIGYMATIAWYEANRTIYLGAKISTDGNSRYAARNVRMVEERGQHNRFTLVDRQNLILLGYMYACGAKTVSKPFLAPLTESIQSILELPDYAVKGDDPEEKVYRLMNKRGNGLRRRMDRDFKNKNGQDLGMIEGRKRFKIIHSIRTGLLR